MPTDKSAVVAAIRAELRARYDRIAAAAAESRGYATDQDSRAEGKYDTRSLEASYLAMGQASKADELAEALRAFEEGAFPAFAETDPADLGALVALRYADGGTGTFLLASRGGGNTVEVEGVTVVVLTPGAPLFRSLVGKKRGERLADPVAEVIGIG